MSNEKVGNFGYVIESKLAGSAYPADLKSVKELGFSAVLNLTDKDPTGKP